MKPIVQISLDVVTIDEALSTAEMAIEAIPGRPMLRTLERRQAQIAVFARASRASSSLEKDFSIRVAAASLAYVYPMPV